MFYLCVYECVGGGGYIYIYIGASKIVIRTLGLILALGIFYCIEGKRAGRSTSAGKEMRVHFQSVSTLQIKYIW